MHIHVHIRPLKAQPRTTNLFTSEIRAEAGIFYAERKVAAAEKIVSNKLTEHEVIGISFDDESEENAKRESD